MKLDCRDHHPDRERPRLLIVEDDDGLRTVLARRLNGNFDVVSVGDGTAAAAELLVNQTFDGVLSDINLPGMSVWSSCASCARTTWTSRSC